MDQTGQIILVATLVALVLGMVGFWLLSKHGPKGATLGVAAVLYLVSYLIDSGGSRVLHGAVGIVRMLGFIGGILGVLDLFRARPKDGPR